MKKKKKKKKKKRRKRRSRTVDVEGFNILRTNFLFYDFLTKEQIFFHPISHSLSLTCNNISMSVLKLSFCIRFYGCKMC